METLKVGVAFPDRPFNSMSEGEPFDAGLDIDLTRALGEKLNAAISFVAVEAGGDILGGLGSDYACAVGGLVVTSEREARADFLPPYLISGQALAVDPRRSPRVTSVDHLDGVTIGVQRGDTAEQAAQQLVDDGKAAAVRVYDHGALDAALTDLAEGACDAVLALAPVLTAAVRRIAGIEVVQRGITVEHIAVAVARGDQALLGRLTVAQAELEDDGTLQRIRRTWLGNPYADQALAVH